MLALPSLPPLLPLGNVADFNICKFIFLRLYLPDHHLSRHCQFLVCVLKASIGVLSIFFLNIFVIKFTGRTDLTHYINVCHLRQTPNHPKQIEDLCSTEVVVSTLNLKGLLEGCIIGKIFFLGIPSTTPKNQWGGGRHWDKSASKGPDIYTLNENWL